MGRGDAGGRYVVSASCGHTLKIWEPASKRVRPILEGHTLRWPCVR
jgi:hypothetical protein